MASGGKIVGISKKVRTVAAGIAALGTVMTAASIDNSGFGAGKCHCDGNERWIVKTLQDEHASAIGFSSPRKISVHDLVAFTRDTCVDITWSKSDDCPRLHEEYKVYTIECRILDALPQSDGDVHLVLCALDNKDTLVGEIPRPDCANVIRYPKLTEDNPYLQEIKAARSDFLDNYLNSYRNGTYLVKGVLFFDTKNHGKGGNKNGVELHPILNIVRQ